MCEGAGCAGGRDVVSYEGSGQRGSGQRGSTSGQRVSVFFCGSGESMLLFAFHTQRSSEFF